VDETRQHEPAAEVWPERLVSKKRRLDRIETSRRLWDHPLRLRRAGGHVALTVPSDPQRLVKA
jgi:hypothetical protein